MFDSQASEDSPQQKSRVALVSIIVTAPSEPGSDGPTTVHPTVKLGLQIASAVVLMSFMCGIIVLIHHRYRLKHTKVRVRIHFAGKNINIQTCVSGHLCKAVTFLSRSIFCFLVAIPKMTG